MPFEVVLPRLGWNMESGRLGEWLKKDGEHVQAGDVLFTVEGDKATQEVEALESGILRIPPSSPSPGQEVPVGTLLAYLVEPSALADFRFETTDSAATPDAVASHRPVAAEDAPAVPPGPESRPPISPPISPRARRVARELGVDWTQLQGSGRTGRIVERDVRQAAAQAPRGGDLPASISPLARRVAIDLGVDVDALAAQMPGQRIRRADVEQEAERAQSARVSPPVADSTAMPAGAILPVTTVRRIIADRMAASAHTVAAVTLTTEADATELVQLRTQLKDDIAQAGLASTPPAAAQVVPSYNDLLAKLVAQALLEHPAVNARFQGDTIVQAATANIGVAVDTDRGLLVPVLRDVQAKSLRQVARESAALVDKARTGRISPDDLHGGTFTITNLGIYEIDAFTPIVNLPECAILGVGRIVPKQVVVDAAAGRVAIRHMVFLSLTFDHRLVDGAPAARFLQRIKQYVEKPYLWLVGQ
jgi:pyruvate dehydrogenase E2 component (dihydrolipoamide acetyltransferase)